LEFIVGGAGKVGQIFNESAAPDSLGGVAFGPACRALQTVAP